MSSEIRDFSFLRYVGWEESECLKVLFSKETISTISRKVTELTRGVDKKNRKIIVPDERIYETLDGVFRGFRPPTGDIHTRYIVPNNHQESMVQSIIDQTIEVIVSNIRGQLGIEQGNQDLSTWIQVYGDFNTGNLTQTPPIKTLNKRPSTMQFHMNY